MELASIVCHGTQAGHCHRDLERKYIKEMSPIPRTFKVPYKDSQGRSDVVLSTDIKMFLPFGLAA